MGSPAPRAPMLLLLLLVLAAGLTRVGDWDLPLHARTGQWIVEHRAVPATNVLSQLHAGWPTVDDKWAFQVVAHLLFDGLSPDAVIAAQLLLIGALFLVLAGTARALGADAWTTLLALAIAAVAARARFTFRPDLVSLLLTALFAREVLTRPPDARQALRLIALQVLWVNLHGYFVTGPLIVLTAGLARLAVGLADPAERRRGGELLLLALALAAACLLNPAGLRGATNPLVILRDLREHYAFYSQSIIEFRPTFADDPRWPWDRDAFIALLAAAAVLLPAWALVARRRDAPSRAPAAVALGLAVLFAAMAPSLRRNMAPFALVVAPLVAAAASRLRPATRAMAPLACAAVALVAWGELSDRTSVHDGLQRRAGLGLSTLAYPDAGLDFIARELPDARVFTSFTWGSTFTGRRWPRQVASIDGNTSGYPTGYLIEVLSALSGADPAAFARITARDREDVALVPVGGPLSTALVSDPDWMLACVGVGEAVWVRRASRDAAWVARHDLLAHWRAGETPLLPDTPRDGLLGALAAYAPVAEVEQGLLLLAAGLPEAGLQRAQAGAGLAPDDPEPVALQGLLLARLGRRDQAREALRSALARGEPDRLAGLAREALEGLGG